MDTLQFPERYDLSTFAWKIQILAESSRDFGTFAYFDSRVEFIDADFMEIFSFIRQKRIGDFVMLKRSNRGILQSTHLGLTSAITSKLFENVADTLKYLPLNDELWTYGTEMSDTSLIIARRSPLTRHLLKWFLSSTIIYITKVAISGLYSAP